MNESRFDRGDRGLIAGVQRRVVVSSWRSQAMQRRGSTWPAGSESTALKIGVEVRMAAFSFEL